MRDPLCPHPRGCSVSPSCFNGKPGFSHFLQPKSCIQILIGFGCFGPERLESANKQLASKTQEYQESNQGSVAKLLAQSKSRGTPILARLPVASASRARLEEEAGVGRQLSPFPREDGAALGAGLEPLIPAAGRRRDPHSPHSCRSAGSSSTKPALPPHISPAVLFLLPPALRSHASLGFSGGGKCT